MFEVGQKIIYGGTGVCVVEKIAPLDFGESGKTELYYVLRPLYQDGVIYAPVQATVYMRPILTAQEVNGLIDRIPAIEAKAFYDRSQTTLAAHYEEILTSHDCHEMLTLTMSLYEKKQQAQQKQQDTERRAAVEREERAARRERLGVTEPEKPASQVGNRRYARGRAYVEDRFVNPDAAEEATRAAAAESEFGESIDSEVEDSVPDTSAEAVPETPAEPEDEGFVEESFIDDDEEQEKKA